MEISPESPELSIDMDLEEVEQFWRQSLPLLQTRGIRLRLGIEEHLAKRRISYHIPPPSLSPLLVSLVLRSIQDPYLLENLFRFTAYPVLRRLCFHACKVLQKEALDLDVADEKRSRWSRYPTGAWSWRRIGA